MNERQSGADSVFKLDDAVKGFRQSAVVSAEEKSFRLPETIGIHPGPREPSELSVPPSSTFEVLANAILDRTERRSN